VRKAGVLLLFVSAFSFPLNAATKTDLWIAHLTSFLATHSDLTAEQRAVVVEGRELLADGLLSRLHSPSAKEAADARAALSSLKMRASASLPKALYAEAFVRLPRPASSAPQTLPGSAMPMITNCNCEPNTGDCPGECLTGSCRIMPDGCGIFGTDICTGLCQ